MTTAQVGYAPVHRWVKHVLGSTHTTTIVGSVIQVMLCSRSYDIVGRNTYVDQGGSRALWS